LPQQGASRHASRPLKSESGARSPKLLWCSAQMGMHTHRLSACSRPPKGVMCDSKLICDAIAMLAYQLWVGQFCVFWVFVCFRWVSFVGGSVLSNVLRTVRTPECTLQRLNEFPLRRVWGPARCRVWRRKGETQRTRTCSLVVPRTDSTSAVTDTSAILLLQHSSPLHTPQRLHSTAAKLSSARPPRLGATVTATLARGLGAGDGAVQTAGAGNTS
jgi:hypothetical protein